MDIISRYHLPYTVTLRFAASLKKHGPMMPPTHKPHQTVTFFWKPLQCFWLIFTPKSTILLIYVSIDPKMSFVAKHNFAIKKWIFGQIPKSPFTRNSVTFFWKLLQCFWLIFTPKSTILLIYVSIDPKMSFVAKHNFAIKKWIFGQISKSPFTRNSALR